MTNDDPCLNISTQCKVKMLRETLVVGRLAEFAMWRVREFAICATSSSRRDFEEPSESWATFARTLSIF